MVVGEREIHHGTHGDDLAECPVVHHNRPLHDGTGAQDRHLRLVDDGCVEEYAPAARIRKRERSAAQLVRADLTGPGTPGQIVDLSGEAANVEVTGVADHRYDETALGVHSDPEMFGIVKGDFSLLRVDDGVQLRVQLERLNRGEREERHEGKPDAFAGLELGPGPLPQAGDVRYVRVEHGGELGRCAQ